VLTRVTLDGVISPVDLKTFMAGLADNAAREAFAKDCGTTLGHLKNVMYGYKPCGPELAVSIERESGRAVTRRELRPEDWERIWPELSKKPEGRRRTDAPVATNGDSRDDAAVQALRRAIVSRERLFRGTRER
jgi:DNA-binding transcriptional regulator YdaS (Cro superfamily)